MTNEYKTSLRFDEDNSKHAKAAAYVQNRDRAKGATITDYVVSCILTAEEGVDIPQKDSLKSAIKEALEEIKVEKYL